MTFGLLFWLLMIMWLVFGFFYNSAPDRFVPYGWSGNSLLLFVLLGILGWAVFGAPASTCRQQPVGPGLKHGAALRQVLRSVVGRPCLVLRDVG